MDPLWLMVVLFLNLSQPCQALQIETTRLSGVTYQVLAFSCGDKLFRVWQRTCDDGPRAWSRTFYLEEKSSGMGFYLNRFGELAAGQSIDATDVYVPRCGT